MSLRLALIASLVILPVAFGSAKPRDLHTWHCVAHRLRVEVMKRDYFGAERFTFDRAQFLVAGARGVARLRQRSQTRVDVTVSLLP